VKLNTRSFAHPSSSRTARFVALGTFALALQVACSDEPPANHPIIPGASGSGAGATSNTSGATSTAGTFGSGGSAGSASTGGTFASAGTPANGGMAGGGAAAGGAGGTTAGTANGGTGGTVVVNPPLDCSKVAGKALPIALSSTWGFPDSGEDSVAEAPIQGGAMAVTAAGLPEGTPDVWSMTWTPATRTFVHWYWHNATANWTGQGVCVADGAKFVTLKAKAATAGVAVEFQAAGVKKTVTLDTQWQDVVIDLPTGYNAIHPAGGVNTGLVVVMVRPNTTDTAVRTIYWYDTRWVSEVGTDGGEGGAGGGGGEGGAN
jgi:hypothetical protein